MLILAVNFYAQRPYGTGSIAQNSPVRILPMQSSTVFYVTKNPEKVEILGTNKEFYKIMLGGNKIGWVKKMSLARIRALFYAIWFIFTVVCVVIAMAVKNSSHRRFRRIWGRFQRYGIGYDIQIIGTPDPRAQLVIANHQSIMDIVVLEETHPADICWIAKRRSQTSLSSAKSSLFRR